MSAIALFVSLGGVGYAAATIGSAQVTNNSLSTRDIKNRTILSKDIGKKTLSSLRGRKGATGARGAPGAPGAAIFDGTIPAGKTVTGAWGGESAAVLNTPTLEWLAIGLPVKAPSLLSNAQVNTAPHADAGDPDPACAGTVGAPTAPPGKVCIYIGLPTDPFVRVEGHKLIVPAIDPPVPGDELGFSISIFYNTTGSGESTVTARGTWAYTAP